jgi:hypothetical protein
MEQALKNPSDSLHVHVSEPRISPGQVTDGETTPFTEGKVIRVSTDPGFTIQRTRRQKIVYFTVFAEG